MSEFIDGNAEGCEAGQVHQEVVDEVFDLSVEFSSEYAAQCDAVDGSQRVVGDEGVALVWGVGDVVEAFYVDGDVEVAQSVFAEVDACVALFEVGVDEVLVYEVFEGVDGDVGDVFGFVAGALAYDGVEVDECGCGVGHGG